jgi:predicted nucleic acid-binding protein
LSAYYFDTSALAKLYHLEVGTPKVVEIVEAIGAQVRISRLSVVELRSVFAIKVRTQVVTREDVGLLLRQFHEDVVAQRFQVFAVSEQEFAFAERLIEKYAFDKPLRTLDAVQLAVALGLKSQGLIDHFVAADAALCEVAALEGFSVLDPEHPQAD